MNRSGVVTIRFNQAEVKALQSYLRRNVYFDSLSMLGRVAAMDFIRAKKSLTLHPNPSESGGKRPWFLWDYDLTEAQAHELLRHAPFAQRKWLLGRMLERLTPGEIVRYVSLEELREALPHVRVDAKVKRHWAEAIETWTAPTPTS